jgi:hypothetical protein
MKGNTESPGIAQNERMPMKIEAVAHFLGSNAEFS